MPTQEITPTPTEEVTPTPTDEQTLTPTPTEEITPTIAPESTETPTPTETVEPTPEEQVSNPEQSNTEPPHETSPPQEEGQILDGVSTSATPTPTIALEPEEDGQLAAIVLENVEAESLNLENVDPSNSATLSTDKADYAPTDTAVITGTGFTPAETYTLTISSDDPPPTSTTVEITADENGSFIYAYQLDGIYRPNYKVVVTNNSTVVGETTFTDSHIVGYTCVTDAQGADDQPNQKDLTQMCYDYSGLPTTVATEWNWDDTSFPGANTGDACSLFDSDNNGFADFATCVTVEEGPPATQKSGSPRVFSCNDSRSDRCAGAGLIVGPYSTNCSVSQQANNPFDSSNDTVANCTTYLSEVGGSTAQLLDVCSFPSDNPNSDPSDCIRAAARSGKLEVVKDLSPNDDAGLFNLQIDSVTKAANVGDGGTSGEQIVSDGNHTVGETAGTSTSLTNYTSTIVCKDLNGTGATIGSSTDSGPLTVNIADNTDVVCTITNTRINNASLTIVKDAVPNDAQDFSFTTTGAGLSNFDLDDDADGTLLNTQTFSNLAAGSYAVAETPVTGWGLTSATCTDGSLVSAINLSAGENATCTFTNTKQGHIIVDKVTNPSGGAQSFDFVATGGTYANFSLTDAATPNDQALAPGTYGVSETVPTGWDLTNASCESSLQDTESAASLDLDAGETITCTFTNTQRGTIIVEKQTNPDAAAGSFTFTGTAAGTISDGGQIVINNLIPGQYTSTENDPTPAFDLTGISCNDTTNGGQASTGDTGTRTATFNLDPGETVTCTFINTQRGSISGYKYEDADGNAATTGDQTVLSGWVIQLWQWVTDTFVNTGLTDTTDGSGFFSFENLVPGLYQLREMLQAGWTKISPTGIGVEVTLTPGETDQNNNFVNYENASVTACKQADPDGLIGTTDGRTNVASWPVDLIKDGQPFDDTQVTGENGCYTWTNLGPGDYGVSEETQTGWTNLNPTTHNFGDVQSGETYSHTFVNTELGSITITKQTNPDLSTQPFTFNLTGGAIDSSILTDGQSDTYSDLLPGNYTITETIPDGWSSAVSVLCGDASYGHPTVLTLAAGQDISCTFTNTQLGQIIVEKQTDPNDSNQSFHFNASYDVDGFDLTDGQQNNSGYLAADTYSVSEVVPEGWDQTSATCSDQSSPNAISLQAGETVTCTFNNTKLPTLSINKVCDPAGDLGKFNLWIDSTQITSDTVCGGWTNGAITVSVGSHTVSETGGTGTSLSNYTSVIGDDCAADGSITLAAGENGSCTITNTKKGHIIVDKVTDPSGVEQSFDFDASGGTYADFSLTDAAAPNNQELVPGTYNVSETVPTGWDLTNTSCISSLGDTETAGNLDLDAGETITCTFTNQKDSGIVVIKQTYPDGSPENFEFDTNYSANFLLTDGFADLSGDLAPGTYSVAELPEAGWDLTSATCDDGSAPSSISLQSGETVTCTFTNTQRGHIIVDKVTNPAGDPQSFDFDATGTGYVDFSLTDLATPNDQALVPGTYGVSETEPFDWDLTNMTCTSSLRDTETAGSLELDAGETITCTFTNTELGNVIVVKYNDHDGDGTKDVADETLDGWEIHLVGTGVNSYQFTGAQVAGQVTFSDLLPNSFTLSEQVKPGWAQTNIACEGEGGIDNDNSHGFSLVAGQDVTCFIGNQGRGSITVYKNIDMNGDGDLDDAEIDVIHAPGWTWDIDGSGNYSASEGENTVGNLPSGLHTISEDQQTDFHVTSLVCGETNYGAVESQQITLNPGDDLVCTFTNTRDTGTIIVHKIIDQDGDLETEEGRFADGGWSIDVDGQEGDTSNPLAQDTDVDGATTFADLKTGNYNVSELLQDGYSFLDAYCDEQEIETGETTLLDVVVGNGDTVDCTFINSPNGSIHGRKWNDENGNGTRFLEEEPYLAGWKIFLDKNDNQTWDEGEPFDITDDGSEFGWYSFEHLFPGTYSVCEVPQDGWAQTSSPTCHTVDIPSGENACPGPEEQNTSFGSTCDFGNQELNPILTITKVNDAAGDKSPGDSVLFTLTVTATQSAAYNVEVTDLPAVGFTYRAGSWTATSSERGDLKGLGITTEPTYASPGIWQLGDMIEDEVVTLTYIADISNDQKPGLYKDLAWAFGCRIETDCVVGDENATLSMAVNPGFVDDNYVGTQVNVVKEQQPGGSIQGEVLGASTELPATGANSAWLALAAILFLFGIGLIAAGRFTRRYYA